jgi:hypothetical protein
MPPTPALCILSTPVRIPLVTASSFSEDLVFKHTHVWSKL